MQIDTARMACVAEPERLAWHSKRRGEKEDTEHVGPTIHMYLACGIHHHVMREPPSETTSRLNHVKTTFQTQPGDQKINGFGSREGPQVPGFADEGPKLDFDNR